MKIKVFWFGAIMVVLSGFGLIAKAAEIHEAARGGNLVKVKEILSTDPTAVKATDENGRTPLHLAAGKGFAEVVDLLISSGAALEAVDSGGNTPLLSAISGNRLEAVKRLVVSGANINAEHPSYGRAIDYAYWQECMQGKSGLTEYLMSRGLSFDPNAEYMATKLNLAVTFGNVEMTKFVLGLGAEVNKISTPDGMTELHFAVLCGSPEIVSLLIDAGAKVNVSNGEGVPILWHAVDGGNTEIVKELIAHGAPADYIDPWNGRTLLHTAALIGKADIAALLLSKKLDVNTVDNEGRTAAYYATKYGNASVRQLLDEAGAKPPVGEKDEIGPAGEPTAALKPGSAVVWALRGGGWVVRTSGHFIIFDALQRDLPLPDHPSLANGFIRAYEIAGQKCLSMYTTYHWPDRIEYIHSIEDSLPAITYIHIEGERWRGCRNTVYVKPYETRDVEEAKIHTIQVAHGNPGLAYLCEVDGLRLYLSGFAADDPDVCSRDLDALAAAVGSIDIALMPVPVSDASAVEMLKMLTGKLKPKMVCLGERRYRSHLYPNVSDLTKDWDSSVTVELAKNAGDHFVYTAEK